MLVRERMGLGVPPLLLRLTIAATFIWAGSGKFLAPMAVSPEEEATIQMIESGKTPADAAPDPDAEEIDAIGEPVALGDGFQVILTQDGDANDDTAAAPDANAAPIDTVKKRTGQDRLAISIYSMARPNEDGKALLPAFMGKGKWPIWIAFAVGMTELVGGILILIGLLTRFAAFMLAGIMVGAIWMTTIGPVMIFNQPGWPSFLHILPAIDYSSPDQAMQTFQAWQSWMFQFAMLMGSLSLVCLGAGPLSVDRFAFGKPGAVVEVDDDDGDGLDD